MRFTTIVGIVLACLAVLAAVLIGSIKALGTAEEYRNVLKTQLRAALEREFVVNGTFEIRSDLPPKLVMTNVTLSNIPGASRSDMIRIGRLEAEADLLSLLFHELKIHRMTMSDVDVLLEKNEKDEANWNFPVLAPFLSQKDHPRQPSDLPEFPGLIDMTDMNIKRMRLAWLDDEHEPSDVFFDEMRFNAADRAAPVTVVSSGKRNDVPFNLSGTLGSMDALAGTLRGAGNYSVKLRAQSGEMTAVVDGSIDSKPDEESRFSAHLKMTGRKLTGLAFRWRENWPFKGPFDVSGILEVSSAGWSLHKADIVMGTPDQALLRYRGKIQSLMPLQGVNGRLVVELRSLQKLSSWMGINFPDIGPVFVSAMAKGTAGEAETKFSIAAARFGAETFDASLAVDFQKASVAGKISLPRLRIDDAFFGWAWLQKERRVSRNFPDTIDLAVGIADFSFRDIPATNVAASVRIKAGKLEIDPFSLVVGDGQVAGKFSWNEKNEATLQLEGERIDLEKALPTAMKPKVLSQGSATFSTTLHARGDDLASLLLGIRGESWLSILDGQVAGNGGIPSLLPDKEGFRCLAAQADMEGGDMHKLALLMDGQATMLAAQGDIGFQEGGRFNLTFAVREKERPVKTTRIIGMRGSFAAPEILPLPHVPAMIPALPGVDGSALSPCLRGVARKRPSEKIPQIFHKRVETIGEEGRSKGAE